MRIQANFISLASIACVSLVSAASISRAANETSTDVAQPRLKLLSHRNPAVSEDSEPPFQFILQFSGTGTCPSNRDASVQADGYLTFQYLDDSNPYHYSVSLCQGFCMITPGCQFVNLYYEHNNGGETTLKCAAYNQIQSASSKTNWGRQQLLPEPAGLSYIRYSSGWSAFYPEVYSDRGAPAPASPVQVPGFKMVKELGQGVYSSGVGIMDIIYMVEYDTKACADLCDTAERDVANQNRECSFFNIAAYESELFNTGLTYCILFSIPPTEDNFEWDYPWDAFEVSASRAYVRD